jgi:hypothetical protein
MTRSAVVCSSAHREESGGSCAEGQLIGMTEWTLPFPGPAAPSEVPCPRR